MQGIVFDVKRFAVHDGPGIRTTIFFKGCNMRCFWCHNPESIDTQPVSVTKKRMLDGMCHACSETIGKQMTVNDVMAVLERERIFMDESGGGVTFSGGEPTLQPQFLQELLRACKTKGIHTTVDTNGSAHERTYTAILPFTDLFLVDLKHANAATHLWGTGASNDKTIANLANLLKLDAHVWVRIPVIPTFNHSNAEMAGIADLLLSMPQKAERVDLLPFHHMAKNKFERLGLPAPLSDIPSLTKSDLVSYKELFESKGFNTIIGG
ncbi:MAG: glycyl-radical enzyme activating protein [Breznakibacter sp.]